jgi:hypothetical protein
VDMTKQCLALLSIDLAISWFLLAVEAQRKYGCEKWDVGDENSLHSSIKPHHFLPFLPFLPSSSYDICGEWSMDDDTRNHWR